MSSPVLWGVHSAGGPDPKPLIVRGTNAHATQTFSRGDLVVRSQAIATLGMTPGDPTSVLNSFTEWAEAEGTTTPETFGEFAVYMGRSESDPGTCNPGAEGVFMLDGITDAFVVKVDTDTTARTAAVGGLPCTAFGAATTSAERRTIQVHHTVVCRLGYKWIAMTGAQIAAATATRSLVTVLFKGTGGGFGANKNLIPTLATGGTVATVVTAMFNAGYVLATT